MREVANRSVMVVEDDGGIREALTDLLEGEGYTVLPVANGQEAVDRLRAAEVVPRLIIADLLMPVMDGRELCAELARDPELSGIPVVMVSADHRLTAQAGDLEAAAYLTKPLDLRRLLSTVEAHCGAP
jgi:CheY-like chemotaxis protein